MARIGRHRLAERVARRGPSASSGWPASASIAGTSARRRSIQPNGSASMRRVADALARDEAGEGRVVVSGVECRGAADGREQVRPPDRLLDRPEDRVAAWLRRRHGAGYVSRTRRSWTRQPVSRVPSACDSSQYSVVTAIGPTITARSHHATSAHQPSRPRRERRARGLSTIYDTRAGRTIRQGSQRSVA